MNSDYWIEELSEEEIAELDEIKADLPSCQDDSDDEESGGWGDGGPTE